MVASNGLFEPGQRLFIRTVTYHLVGEVVALGEDGFVELKDAAWVADSGRFAQAIATGTLNEVEPVGRAWVNTASITDVFPWAHDVPATALGLGATDPRSPQSTSFPQRLGKTLGKTPRTW